jgi:predicted 2-oxoglutarate/Fe(II)-dependent dioxygenase YbiX
LANATKKEQASISNTEYDGETYFKENPVYRRRKYSTVSFIRSLCIKDKNDVLVNLDAINLNIVTNNQLGRSGKTKT